MPAGVGRCLSKILFVQTGSTVTVVPTEETLISGPLTSRKRDRLAWEALEKKIAEKLEARRRLAAVAQQADRLKAEMDDIVIQLLEKLDRFNHNGITFSDLSCESTVKSTPITTRLHPNHLHCVAERCSLVYYGCEDVQGELRNEMDRLQKAVAALGLMEANPLSASGGFRKEAHRLKEEMAQFVEKVTVWGRHCLDILSEKNV